MGKPIYRQLLPILLLLGCTRAMSDQPAAAPKASFSRSSSDVVLRVTWTGARTPRKWSRSFFGDGRVEAADIGFDGKAIDPVRSWSVDQESLSSALATAVERGLTTSSQEQMLERIRSTGRSAAYAEDEISLTVELRFAQVGGRQGARTEEVRVYRTRDPLGMAKRFPEIPELAALAHLYEFARHSEPQ